MYTAQGKLHSPTAFSDTPASCAFLPWFFRCANNFFPGNCLPRAIIRNDFHVHFAVRCLFCLLKKSRLQLCLPPLPATQLRLSVRLLLFESLVSISSHAGKFCCCCSLTFLAFCKSRSYKERNKSTVIKKYDSSMNSFPVLKNYYVVQRIYTGILVLLRFIILGSIAYSMAMTVIL